MRKLAVILSVVALLGAGAAVAVAGGGGSTHHANAAHYEYHHKPGCGPDWSGGWAGGSGYHSGQPSKDHHRGDCPKPPCDHYSRYSAHSSGGGGDNSCCDQQNKYSGSRHGKSGPSGNNDCRHS